MKRSVLIAISTLKIKNTQLSDCRIVGNELWKLENQSFLQVYFRLRHGQQLC